MDCSLPGSSVHGIFQAIVLEWIAISFFRGSSQPRDRTQVSRIIDRCFTVWATREVLSKRSQTQKATPCTIPCVWHSRKGKSKGTENIRMAAKGWRWGLTGTGYGDLAGVGGGLFYRVVVTVALIHTYIGLGRIDAFELWRWRRLFRVPWTARRSNQSVLKEISLEYSLEGLMLKLSFEKNLMLGKIEGRRRRGQQRMRRLDGITNWTYLSLSKLRDWWWTGKPGVLQSMGSQRVRHNWA